MDKRFGQLFVCGFQAGEDLSEPTPEILELISDYGLGAVIRMRRNIADIQSTRKLINNLQNHARVSGHVQPLLIGTDQEGGLAAAFSSPISDAHKGTQLPGAMACAACPNPLQTVKEVTLATSAELKLAGFNWPFSPIADINSNPLNPVIGSRAFGDDPQEVAALVGTAVKAQAEVGLASCPKHFPGHGDTAQDSHLSPAVVNKSLDELEACELLPFRRVGQSASTIMTAHVSLPQIDGEIPSSLSRIITTDLLRHKIGFKGAIVTDCLEMDAVMALPGGTERAAVKAIAAGADVAMACHTASKQRGAIKQLNDAVQEGEIAREQVEASLLRVKMLKDRYAGSWEDLDRATSDTDFDQKWAAAKQRSQQVARKAYAESITLVRGNIETKATHKKMLLLSPFIQAVNRAVDDEDNSNRAANNKAPFKHLEQSLRDRECVVEHTVYQPNEAIPAHKAEPDLVIFVSRNADRASWQRDGLYTVQKRHTCPIIVVASCGPYDFLDDVAIQPYICTYEYTPPAMEALAAVLCGEQQPVGKLPVRSADGCQERTVQA